MSKGRQPTPSPGFDPGTAEARIQPEARTLTAEGQSQRDLFIQALLAASSSSLQTAGQQQVVNLGGGVQTAVRPGLGQVLGAGLGAAGKVGLDDLRQKRKLKAQQKRDTLQFERQQKLNLQSQEATGKRQDKSLKAQGSLQDQRTKAATDKAKAVATGKENKSLRESRQADRDARVKLAIRGIGTMPKDLTAEEQLLGEEESVKLEKEESTRDAVDARAAGKLTPRESAFARSLAARMVNLIPKDRAFPDTLKNVIGMATDLVLAGKGDPEKLALIKSFNEPYLAELIEEGLTNIGIKGIGGPAGPPKTAADFAKKAKSGRRTSAK